jgi:hypothetical protein
LGEIMIFGLLVKMMKLKVISGRKKITQNSVNSVPDSTKPDIKLMVGTRQKNMSNLIQTTSHSV